MSNAADSMKLYLGLFGIDIICHFDESRLEMLTMGAPAITN
jgi:hypothetical protein